MSTVMQLLTRLAAGIAPALLIIAVVSAQPLRPPAEDPREDRASRPATEREPGYLGLITDDRSEQGRGVRVVKVVEGSPAAEAGFQVGDLIVAIEGQRAASLDDVAAQLQPHSPGDKIRFEVQRANSAQETVEVTLGRRPPQGQRPFEFGRIPERLPEPDGNTPPSQRPAPLSSPPAVTSPSANAAGRGQLLGIRTGAVNEDLGQRLGLPTASGARVVSRVVGSPAERAGIPLDAVIVSADGQPVASPTDLAQLIAAAGPGREVELNYYAGGELRKATVTLAGATTPPAATDLNPLVGAPPPPLTPPPSTQPPSTRPPSTRARSPLPPSTQAPQAADRIEQLERRIRELEQRVRELERALGPSLPSAPANRSTE
jgi:PDZ domain